jgi:transposase-like protein|tara:strand:- start:3 stop:284 length:282 start_codon:yes stop_codon:yes gene_type:complete
MFATDTPRRKSKHPLANPRLLFPDRDRDASFNPTIVPMRGNMVDGIENVIVPLYAKGMSNSDIEEQIREVYGFDVSTSTISRIAEKISGDIVA